MGRDRIHLSLELLAGRELIKGTLADDRGQSLTFEGWMELAAALDSLMHSAPHAPAPSTPTAG